MIRGGDVMFWGVFLEKKGCSAKSDEKIVCSANCEKIKSLFTKLAENWGYIGKKVCLFLCLREIKSLFLVRSGKKKFAQEKKP